MTSRVRLTTIATLALALGLSGGVGPASAAFPGTPGRLVFESARIGVGSASDIYTARSDLTGLRRLTFDGRSHNPRWSADGRRIVFNRGGDIYVMSASGANVRRITSIGRSYQPAWSPNGRTIAFVHVPAGGQGDIWTVAAAGGTPHRLTFDGAARCGDSRPVWSPLGGRIVYEQPLRLSNGTCGAEDWEPKQSVVLLLRTRTRTVIPDARRPDFTADGHGLTFAGLYDADGQTVAANGDDLLWSTLNGGARSFITNFYCAEGDPCFVNGSPGPTSDYPGHPDLVATTLIWNGGDTDWCIRTIIGGVQTLGCRPYGLWPALAEPRNVNWGPAPSG